LLLDVTSNWDQFFQSSSDYYANPLPTEDELRQNSVGHFFNIFESWSHLFKTPIQYAAAKEDQLMFSLVKRYAERHARLLSQHIARLRGESNARHEALLKIESRRWSSHAQYYNYQDDFGAWRGPTTQTGPLRQTTLTEYGDRPKNSRKQWEKERTRKRIEEVNDVDYDLRGLFDDDYDHSSSPPDFWMGSDGSNEDDDELNYYTRPPPPLRSNDEDNVVFDPNLSIPNRNTLYHATGAPLDWDSGGEPEECVICFAPQTGVESEYCSSCGYILNDQCPMCYKTGHEQGGADECWHCGNSLWDVVRDEEEVVSSILAPDFEDWGATLPIVNIIDNSDEEEEEAHRRRRESGTLA
jgi:hypothetical protein